MRQGERAVTKGEPAQRSRDVLESDVPAAGFGRVAAQALEIAEDVMYADIALRLIVAALVLLAWDGCRTDSLRPPARR